MTLHDGQVSLDAVKAFFRAYERRDVEPIEATLAADVVEVIPLSASGSPEPFDQFAGKAAVMGCLGQIAANFSRTVQVDQRFTVSDDGGTVFLEAKGDLVQADTGTPHHNVHVFEFTFEDGLQVHGAREVNAANEAGAHAFSDESTGRLEILQSSSDGDLGFWTGIQHAEATMHGKDEPVPIQLRVTEVFRREAGGWKLVYRHADMVGEGK